MACTRPVEFSDSLINAYAEVPELVSMVHLPVQSGSDRILAAMKRGHTADEYREKIKRLRAVRPGISISSDFIIGFPGESDEDFNATMQLVADIGFDQSYSFIYSARPGTPAAVVAPQRAGSDAIRNGQGAGSGVSPDPAPLRQRDLVGLRAEEENEDEDG